MLPQIFVYGDSMSWGIVPMTRKRFPFESRWPGVMQIALSEAGLPVHVIEDCLNGRRTVWEDPFKAGRNGLTGLTQRIEVNSPLALAIIMLGTNDFQSMHPHNAWHSAQGVGVLVKAIREAPIEPGMPVPPILVVAPPPTHNPQGPLAPKFKDAEAKSAGLADALRDVTTLLECHFFDASTVTASSRVDGIHLDEDQHVALGRAMADAVRKIL
ncbi:MAG TPA: SGNH/GDSL hydrolase family protein [Terriglobia bacterium]|nr:SGNH/GDSL hydrolase family protein [Terriglobia bacterium]